MQRVGLAHATSRAARRIITRINTAANHTREAVPREQSDGSSRDGPRMAGGAAAAVVVVVDGSEGVMTRDRYA